MENEKKRILLVEDEAILAAAEKLQLERYGYAVSHAKSGEEAIGQAVGDGGEFDAILMDIDLGPGIDGTEAAAEILKTKDVPIVFVSSHVEPEIVRKTENITSYGYVVKNSGIVVLDASIKMALKLFTEKTERRQAEDQVRQLKDIYAALSQINQAIVRVDTIEELAGEVSRVAVGFGPFKLAWVGRHDAKTREVIPIGTAGEPASLITRFRHSSDEAARHPCLCGPAIRENRSCVADGLSVAPEAYGPQPEMERAGIKAAAVMPVRVKSAVWGVFGVYAGEAGIFGEKEMRLLEEAAMDIGYAVERIESEERRKEAEKFQRLSAAVLGVLNGPAALSDTSRTILGLIKKEFDLDAAGIRLKDGDDFPFFSGSGFGEEFLLAENSLARREGTGVVCREPDGSVCLECTCGLVLSGKCGPPGDNVTPGGSLWTNDSLATAEALRGQDPRSEPRDRCSHDGYLSIALIPIRVDDEIIGLLHLDDRRKGRFTPESIRFFEGLSASFGIAVERKRAEERLRVSEERFRLALAHAPVSVAVQDLDLRFTWAYNQRTRRPDEIIGKTDYDLFPMEAERLIALKRRAIETGEGAGEQLWITSNGRRLFLDLHIEPLRGEKGEVRSLGLVAVDLTAFKETEEKLQTSEAKFKAVFENAPIGISILSADRELLGFNEPLERILRIGKDQLAGGSYRRRAYIREDGTAMPSAELASARAIAEQSAIRNVVNGIVLDDGEIVWTQVSAAPLGIPGSPIVVITQDITDRKLIEQELTRQLAEKESVVKEINHRIKNSIASIEGFLSLQADSAGNDEVDRALRESIARVQSIRVLYEKLLISPDHRAVSTRAYIESLIDSLAEVYPERRNVTIALDIDDIQLASSAMNSVGIIINELVTNIYKYAFPGRDDGRVSISLREEESTVTLTVADDGVGFAPGTAAGSSSGFGLTLAGMLAEQLNGSFSISDDRGTKAVLSFGRW